MKVSTMSEMLDHSVTCAILEELPAGILLMNNRQIEWVNKTLADTLHTPKTELHGLGCETASGTVLAPIFEDSDRICITDSDDRKLWLKRQIIDIADKPLKAHIFTDITHLTQLETELERLVADVQNLQTKHPITGLLNRKTILHTLDTQVSRSRRYENPLALLRLSLKSETSESENQETLRHISQMLKDQLRWADQIGMIDDSTFLIILPETSLSAAKELATKLANDRTTLGDHHANWSIKFGAAGWQKGDDPEKLLNRVQVDQELNCSALLS